MELLELKPLESQQKSFYGKAKYYRDGWSLRLISYDTEVAEYNMLTDTFTIHRLMSETTLRHIIAFAAQTLQVDIKNRKDLEGYMKEKPERFGGSKLYE